MQFITKNGVAARNIWIKKNCAAVIKCAADNLRRYVEDISGAKLNIYEFRTPSEIYKDAIVLIEKKDCFSDEVKIKLKDLRETDGFCVFLEEGKLIIASNKAEGVYFGVHGYIEENAEIIWPRGKQGFDCLFRPQKDIPIIKYNYIEKPCFAVRGWHACGTSDGALHADTPTALWHSKNKINTKLLQYKEIFRNFGLRPHGTISHLNNIDDLAETHPEYFMIDLDGKSPKKGPWESFINYYNLDAAKVAAKRIIEARKRGELPYNTMSFIMPDSRYFKMVVNGEELSAQPFVTTDGQILMPQDEAYRSTVYFTFMNEMAKVIAEEIPDFELCTFAYMYSERCPKVKIHKNITVWLAWIDADMHISYEENKTPYGKILYRNFCEWSKISNNVVVYDYLGTYNINAYSRPIAKVAQKNFQFYKRLGFKGVLPEALIDSEQNPDSKNVYEMNELYFWLISRLMWNPDLDLEKEKNKFCKLAYGKAAKYMQNYYHYIEKGWDNGRGIVRYSTGGDVYIGQFIIEQNLQGKILDNLGKALDAAEKEQERARIYPIYETMKKQIGIYLKAKKEDVFAIYTDIGYEKIFSEEHSDYKNNPLSIWNKAIPLKVLQNYNTMEDFPEEAHFEARILWDKNYIYFGFSVTDDELAESEELKVDSAGSRLVYRENGELIESYSETYISGNENNKSTYYGYISGFFPGIGPHCYKNIGAPELISLPENFRFRDFIHYDKDPHKRYYFHIQAIAFKDLEVEAKDALPCISFVYFNNRYGRAGWKGNGLWCKEKLQRIKMIGG